MEAQKTRESLAIAHVCLPKRDAKTLMLKPPYTWLYDIEKSRDTIKVADWKRHLRS